MLALLKDGDTVTAQGNRLFINSEEVVNPNGYTFSGENSQGGIELVKIWYFQNEDSTLTLSKLDVVGLKAITRTVNGTPPVLSGDFYDYIREIEYDVNITQVPHGVQKQRCNVGGEFNDYVSESCEEYYNSCISLPVYFTRFLNRSNLKILKLPYVETIPVTPNATSSASYGFGGCTALERTEFDSLTLIDGNSQAYGVWFSKVGTITLPESLTELKKYKLQNRKIRNEQVRLVVHDKQKCLSVYICIVR